MEDGAKANWYAVNTKPHQEDLAECSLKRLGVETFCPLLKQMKVIRRKRRVVVAPLFPGYIFARFRLDVHYRSVNYAQGVRKLVAFGQMPTVVDDAIIESIRSRIHDGFIGISSTALTPGQVVMIQQGPLQGLEAIFNQELSDRQRVVLLLRTLSYQARVVTSRELVVGL